MPPPTRRRLLQNGAAFAAFSPFIAACSPKAPKETMPVTTPSANASTAQTVPFADGVKQVEMLASGETTSLELTEAAIARAKASQPLINAIATETYDAALSEAAAAPPGVFSGVPTFIKDLIDWKGVRRMSGSRALQGHIAAEDDALAASWRRMGIISLGKSTTPEEGLISSTEPLVTGATRNPWDTSRIPGGSSGGAAALVAARVVPFAHASDGGGSIRIPAACCGLFGLKPSRDAMASSRPPAPVVISANHAVTLSVRDSAALFAGAEAPSNGLGATGHITGPATRRLKIAFAPEATNGAVLDQDTRDGIERTAQLCRDLGHEVIDFALPLDGEEFGDRFLLYWAAGAAQFAQEAARFAGKPPGPDILEPWTLGLAMQFLSRAGEIDDAVAYLQAFEGVYHSWFKDFDVILSPTVSTVAPKVGEQAPDGDFETVMKNVLDFAAFTSPMNVAGAASMSVPVQWSDDGLPVGSMFSGQRGDDGLLLALAYELEAAQPWIDRVPIL
ncbi:MAG: amidase [Henriciella sp.]|nr:amidase [Henriciella sp.]